MNMHYPFFMRRYLQTNRHISGRNVQAQQLITVHQGSIWPNRILAVCSIMSLIVITWFYSCQISKMKDTIGIQKQGYADQVQEMKINTERQWRPYLYLDQSPDSVSLRFLRQDSTTKCSYLQYKSKRKIGFKNSGQTPLRITNHLISTVTKYEWEQVYQQIPESLVIAVKRSPELKPWPYDFVVLPDSSKATMEQNEFGRNIPDSLIKESLADDGSLLIYPYTYIEYEDVFGHTYNTILIEMMHVIPNPQKDGSMKAIVLSRRTEKYRWDIMIR